MKLLRLLLGSRSSAEELSHSVLEDFNTLVSRNLIFIKINVFINVSLERLGETIRTPGPLTSFFCSCYSMISSFLDFLDNTSVLA